MAFDYKNFKKTRSGKNETSEWAGWKWVKFSVATICYLAFLYWVESWWGLIVVPFIYDAYISKKIKWTWWKELESDMARTIMSWVDAIVFALVAVYFVNNFFFGLSYCITLLFKSLNVHFLELVSELPA